MTPKRWMKAKKIAERALEREVAHRGAFVRDACDKDRDLIASVEVFLGTDREPTDFLQPPTTTTIDAICTEFVEAALVGSQIGAYRVTEVLASGGMGTVYRAVRADDEYEKEVAIKVIHQEMASVGMRQRFQQERQTLAGLEHPSITRLIDGGTTDDGLPYLVMEYVEGSPIDRHCDERRLSITDRLRLFRRVCTAVHHAHQNLIVHRDLKPANILITPDGDPKLLDFGIARLLDEPTTAASQEATVTIVRAMTPHYASPEQIRGGVMTTATDVYSLGVILYELLSGHRPYRLDSDLIYERERIVCEQEPAFPSSAVGTSETLVGATGSSHTITPEEVGRFRSEHPRLLQRRLRGDVDNIVLMSLQKDPKRRYASVEQFSEDIGRYLDGLPVIARKNTLTYRSVKLIKRNKGAVLALCTLTLALVAGIVGTTAGLWSAVRARSDQEAVIEFLSDTLAVANPYRTGRDVTLLELLEEAADRIEPELADRPVVEADVRFVLGQSYAGMWMWEEAVPHLRRALAITRELNGNDDPKVAEILCLLGRSLAFGRQPESVQLQEESLAIRRQLFGPEHALVAESYASVGFAIWQTQPERIEESEAIYREALALYHRLGLGMHPDVGRFTFGHAMMLGIMDRPDEAKTAFRDALDVYRHLGDRNDRYMVECMNRFADYLMQFGQDEEAEAVLRESLEHTPVGGGTAGLYNPTRLLAEVERRLGRPHEALRLHAEALGIKCRRLATQHPESADRMLELAREIEVTGNIGTTGIPFNDSFRCIAESAGLDGNDRYRWMLRIAEALSDRNQFSDAESLSRYCLEMLEGSEPEDDLRIGDAQAVLGGVLTAAKEFDAAEGYLLTSLEQVETAPEPHPQRRRGRINRLIRLYEAWGKPEEVKVYRAMLGEAE